MRLPRLPKASSLSLSSLSLSKLRRPTLPGKRSTQAVVAGGVAVLLAAGTVVTVGLTTGGDSDTVGLESPISLTPGWLTDPETGLLKGATGLPEYPVPTVPVPVAPPATPAAPGLPAPVVPSLPAVPTPSTAPSAPSATTGSGGSGGATATPTPTLPASEDVSPPLATGRTLPTSLFGLHASGLGDGKAPATEYGAVRLWDSGTTWRQIEPANDKWDWTRLDKAVATARRDGARPLLVLGQTPEWAAANPGAQSFYGAGASSPPRNNGEWVEYVKAVATRYKGKITEYEIWNEPNVTDFWRGTEAQLVTLARLAHDTIKAVDPGATVTTPSFVVRRPAQQAWLTRYLVAGGADSADVVNVHIYPDSSGTPETMLKLYAEVRARLDRRDVSLPVWNTEVNYGLPTGGTTAPLQLPDTAAAGYVARTYLLTASLGISRAYWYMWDNPQVGVGMTSDGTKLTPAGRAYAVVRGWLAGRAFRGCALAIDGTWTCWVGGDRVVWNPAKAVKLTVPSGTTGAVGINGKAVAAKPGSSLTVGVAPVLLKDAG
ncbi:GH39 family glycosyl hydrolase [Motilibacter deserti]|uniref:Glycosyl hydrolases family 39 N-terminal catalytic domain-containing protein n=1 Tax=Motilibacter deserti TaxID=2714956 RepID=A0ABX0GR50_9ACTN|nr:cellulase family glycosylhydrolase [Motilibacter deserti]NHC12339.1 hypothetical protein [Motilibacter deserti]